VSCSTARRASRRAVSEATACLMASMLSDVIKGPAARARQMGSRCSRRQDGNDQHWHDALVRRLHASPVTGVGGVRSAQTIASGGYALVARGRSGAPSRSARPAATNRGSRAQNVGHRRAGCRSAPQGCDSIVVNRDSLVKRSMLMPKVFVAGRTRPSSVALAIVAIALPELARMSSSGRRRGTASPPADLRDYRRGPGRRPGTKVEEPRREGLGPFWPAATAGRKEEEEERKKRKRSAGGPGGVPAVRMVIR
jgi:hypothetical protein